MAPLIAVPAAQVCCPVRALSILATELSTRRVLQFFSFLFESLLFGIFLVLYCIALRVSLNKHRTNLGRAVFFVCGVASLMLLLAGTVGLLSRQRELARIHQYSISSSTLYEVLKHSSITMSRQTRSDISPMLRGLLTGPKKSSTQRKLFWVTL